MSCFPGCPGLQTGSYCPSAGALWEAEPLVEEGVTGAPQTPTDLTVIRLPGQEAAAGTRVPDADLACIGAAVQKGRSAVAQRRQLACLHSLRDGLSVHLEGFRAV